MSLEKAIAKLESTVGTETHVGEWLTITQDRVDQFAEATGDHQWIHTDPERAKDGPFGATIAHGYLSLALIPYLTDIVSAEQPPFEGIKMGINYGLNRVRFPNPVRAGSRVRARVRLQEFEEVAGGGVQIVHQVTVEIEGEPKPGCVAETVSRFYF